jgi:hypothetical protein
MCEKLSYESFAEAQKVVNMANNSKRKYIDGRRVNRNQNKKPKRAYKCEKCGLYHMTSQKNKKRGLH